MFRAIPAVRAGRPRVQHPESLPRPLHGQFFNAACPLWKGILEYHPRYCGTSLFYHLVFYESVKESSERREAGLAPHAFGGACWKHPKRFKGAWPSLESEMLGMPGPLAYGGVGSLFFGVALCPEKGN